MLLLVVAGAGAGAAGAGASGGVKILQGTAPTHAAVIGFVFNAVQRQLEWDTTSDGVTLQGAAPGGATPRGIHLVECCIACIREGPREWTSTGQGHGSVRAGQGGAGKGLHGDTCSS
jgi:hypothetical protein